MRQTGDSNTSLSVPLYDFPMGIGCQENFRIKSDTIRDHMKGRQMSRFFQVHPAIGIARLGDSPREYWLPEERVDSTCPKLDIGVPWDESGRIKRQAARFRIYEYDGPNGRAIREIAPGDLDVAWSVHVANIKAFQPERNVDIGDLEARSRLRIDPGQRRIESHGQPTILSGSFLGVDVKLGEALLDDKGRLWFLGGHGTSGSPTDQPLKGVHNDGWHDDTCDGVVSAILRDRSSGQEFHAEAARIISCPPDYAPDVGSVITLWDLALNAAFARWPALFPEHRQTSFTRDIYPLLKRIKAIEWVDPRVREANQRSSFQFTLSQETICRLSRFDAEDAQGMRLRAEIVDGLLDPAQATWLSQTLLRAVVPDLTVAHLRRWRNGEFVNDWNEATSNKPIDRLPVEDQPRALDRFHLEGGQAGRFQPGIEVINALHDPNMYDAPFRIASKHPPGTLTKHLGLPWQVDFFDDCQWWPTIRPLQVTHNVIDWSWWRPFRSDDFSASLEDWKTRGFVFADGDGVDRVYLERPVRERRSS